jgi:hypothetical protein
VTSLFEIGIEQDNDDDDNNNDGLRIIPATKNIQYYLVKMNSSANQRLPVIQVTMSKGRTVEQKRELVQVLTEESARILKTKK